MSIQARKITRKSLQWWFGKAVLYRTWQISFAEVMPPLTVDVNSPNGQLLVGACYNLTLYGFIWFHTVVVPNYQTTKPRNRLADFFFGEAKCHSCQERGSRYDASLGYWCHRYARNTTVDLWTASWLPVIQHLIGMYYELQYMIIQSVEASF